MDSETRQARKGSGVRNPSRKQCEAIIRRILMAEVLEKGTNSQFRTASDFMTYFESLYPGSPSLRKQVQRALKELDLPKTKGGFLIINKTRDQLKDDEDLGRLLESSGDLVPLDLTALFLPVPLRDKDYLLERIRSSATFRGKYLTIINSSDGLVFLTSQPSQLTVLVESLKKVN